MGAMGNVAKPVFRLFMQFARCNQIQKASQANGDRWLFEATTLSMLGKGFPSYIAGQRR